MMVRICPRRVLGRVKMIYVYENLAKVTFVNGTVSSVE
jgi:hypothetical protein